MKINDFISETDLTELSLGGNTTTPTPGITGPGTAMLGTPASQAMMLTKQKQAVTDQRKMIQDEIAQLTKRIDVLKKQLATLR